MTDLIIMYGPTAIGAIFTALAALVARWFAQHQWLQAMLGRLVTESKAVVLETEQTYVLTEGNSDGRRAAAMATLKSNLGVKGLRRLGRVLGLADPELDRLLGTHVEAAVAQLSLVQNAPSKALTMSTPPLSSSR